jgi:hypothetical protein
MAEIMVGNFGKFYDSSEAPIPHPAPKGGVRNDILRERSYLSYVIPSLEPKAKGEESVTHYYKSDSF